MINLRPIDTLQTQPTTEGTVDAFQVASYFAMIEVGLFLLPQLHYAPLRPPRTLRHACFILTCPLRRIPLHKRYLGPVFKSTLPSQNTHLPIPPHPTPLLSPATFQNELESLRKLALSSGALGRGVRATLLAFYRRGIFLLTTGKHSPAPTQKLYIEIGPAYVLATASLGNRTSRVTRFAVEQRAWPTLRRLLKWHEVSAESARQSGASLRKLVKGGRYGRHIFLTQATLSNILTVAEELLADDEHDPTIPQTVPPRAAAFSFTNVEAIIKLKRLPVPSLRTVAAKCPRGLAHKHGDQNPSLVLWMNDDGLTGGALCPVCLEEPPRQNASNLSVAPRNMTWRVIYVRDNLAALCTPLRRVCTPPNVTRIASKWLDDQRKNLDAPHHSQPHSELQVAKQMPIPSLSKKHYTNDGNEVPAQAAASGWKESRGRRGPKSATAIPVGGCVLRDKRKIQQIGRTTSLAYVTASLKIARDATTTGPFGELNSERDETRLRTVGAKARFSCPMQILLWSERRSKGPTSSRRIEDVSWFAKQALCFGPDDEDNFDDGTDSLADSALAAMFSSASVSEEWVPTPVVSVSAMRPCGWRDVTGTHKRFVSVPSGWEAVVQAWVLFDIDDIDGLINDGIVEDIGGKITLAIRRNVELSGRCLVVQTGPNGLHVWAELREIRDQARLWFKKEETRLWYADIGQKLLTAAYKGGASGGKVDMSSCCAGRFARRPGWRLLKDGTAFRSRVVTYVLGRVKSRKARM